MKTHTSINFSHLEQNAPLSPADEQLVNWWRKMYGKSIWMWIVFLLLFLPLTATAYLFFLQGKIDWIAVLVFVPFELFFIWKLVEASRKTAKVKSALRKGLKQIYAGILLELKTSNGNCLKYKIDHNTIKVNAPGPFSGLIGAEYLRNSKIRLETVAISAKENLLLAVQYPDIQLAEREICNISPQEKAKHNKAYEKSNGYVLKVMGFILPIILVALLWVYGIDNFLIVFGACATLALGYYLTTNSIHRHIQSYHEKLMITGVVTEAIEIRYHRSSRNFIRMRWYRVGAEMVPGKLNNEEEVVPGDNICFEYYIDEKGKRKDVIKITRLT